MIKVGVNLPKGTNISGNQGDGWVMGRYNKHTTHAHMQHSTVYTVYNEHEQQNFTQLKTNQTNDCSNTPNICWHKDHDSFWTGIYENFQTQIIQHCHLDLTFPPSTNFSIKTLY